MVTLYTAKALATLNVSIGKINHFSRAPRASISSHLARVPTGCASQPPPACQGWLLVRPPGWPPARPAAHHAGSKLSTPAQRVVAVSLERLEQDANGDLMYLFNRPWSDGTTGIKLSPLELLEKLVGARALAACSPGPLCWLFGAAQQAPGCDCPDTASAGCRRRGDEDGNPVLELGQAAWSRV